MQNKNRTSKRERLTKLKAMSHFMMKELVRKYECSLWNISNPPTKMQSNLEYTVYMFVVVVNKKIFGNLMTYTHVISIK